MQSNQPPNPWRLSVAPMMEWTDRHCRYFHRLLTARTRLYTEMVTTGALLHGDVPRHLDFNAEEHPLALQLGGSEPHDLAHSAKLAEQWGYDEVNLNCGCPSERVQRGAFGACLMAESSLVADCVKAMRDAVAIPVTVKHRIGIDDRDAFEDLTRFVNTVAEAGCDRFIVHARKAWLSGLSPKDNRTVPPLRYDDVVRLKQELPQLAIEINGGIATLEAVREHLRSVDGAMIGRAAWDDPYLLAAADQEIYGDAAAPPTRREVVQEMLPYVEVWRRRGAPLLRLVRPMLGLFAGRPGARAWKRHLSEHAHLPGAGPEVILEALARVSEIDARCPAL